MNRRVVTARQIEVLRWVHTSTVACGYSPTYAEIASGMGLGVPSVAFNHVSALIVKGLLTNEKNRARSLRVTEAGEAVLDGAA